MQNHHLQPDLPKTWAWCNVEDYSDDSVKEFLERNVSNGITGLLPSGSNGFYERITRLAEGTGVEIHAWRWTMNRRDYMRIHPEWYAVNRNGESCAGDHPPYVDHYRWLCPSHEEVTEVIARDYESLCDIPGMAGVQLDFIRYCDVYLPKELQPKYNLVQDHEMPQFDYCYCPLCRKLFKEESGIDPLELDDPPSNKAWHAFRLKQVVKVANAIAERVHKKGKIITGAVFPTPAMSRKMVRQDWSQFSLDAFMPMLYNIFYGEPVSWIGECVKESLAEIPDGIPVYAGIFKGALKNEEEISIIHNDVKEKGGAGLSFFTSENLSSADLKVIRSLG